MKRFLRPLWVFVSGQVIMLALFLFFPQIATSLTGLAAVEGAGAALWGWIWLIPAARILIVIIVEGLTLYAVALSWPSMEGG